MNKLKALNCILLKIKSYFFFNFTKKIYFKKLIIGLIEDKQNILKLYSFSKL